MCLICHSLTGVAECLGEEFVPEEQKEEEEKSEEKSEKSEKEGK